MTGDFLLSVVLIAIVLGYTVAVLVYVRRYARRMRAIMTTFRVEVGALYWENLALLRNGGLLSDAAAKQLERPCPNCGWPWPAHPTDDVIPEKGADPPC